MSRVHVLVSGRVQGVGYRYFVYEQAYMLGVNGWVKNLPDGRVEAELEGDESAIEKMLEKLREGPPMSKVENVVIEELSGEASYSKFEVR